MKLHLIIMFTCISTFVFSQKADTLRIHFNTDEYVITKENHNILNDYLSGIDIASIAKIEIIGHTDSVGSIQYNNELSNKRAKSITSHFISNKISPNIISTQYFGEKKSVINSKQKDLNTSNRRVEIVISYKQKENSSMPAETKLDTDLKTPIEKDTIVIYTNESIIPFEKKDYQVFEVNPNSNITITGKYGTNIEIPKKALVFANGERAKSVVTIQLIEVYSTADMVLHNLTTMSDGKILETGGMIFIQAFANGEELQIKSGTNYTITFNTLYDKDMQIFTPASIKRMQPGRSISNVNWQIRNTPSNTATAILNELDTSNRKVDFGSFEGDSRSLQLADTLPVRNEKVFNEFGWINCDKFVNEKNLTSIRINDLPTAEYTLVFTKINSVMPAFYFKKHLEFVNIPVGKKANIVKIKKGTTGYFYAIQPIKVEKDHVIEGIQFEATEISLTELKRKLNNLK